MDALLIYPPLTVDERYAKKSLGNVGGHLPPLGIVYLAAVLRQNGFKVSLIDGPASGLNEEEILKEIEKIGPKVIGISAITPLFHRAIRLAENIRARFSDILIVIGGHHVSIEPIKALEEYPSFDIAVYGEGENTMLELVKNYQKYNFERRAFLSDFNLLNSMDGVVFRRLGQVIMTHPRTLIKNLDDLPSPAWDLLPMDRYIPLPNQYLNKPVINMIAIRGCPFHCSFCSTHAVFGNSLRFLSPERLIKQIEEAKSNFGIREVSFWDDSLTVDKKWLLDFCEEVIRHKLNITWTCYSRVDTVDKDILNRMRAAGCWNIFYGYESGNQELLDGIDKNITLEKIREVNRWTKEAGIEIRAAFMIALPKETPEMARKTIDFAISLEPDYAQFTITTPHPKTKLFQEAKKYGTLSADLSKYNHWEPVFVPYGYKNKEEIKKLHAEAFRRFYMRPKYFYGRLKKIKSLSDILRYLDGLKVIFGFLRQ